MRILPLILLLGLLAGCVPVPVTEPAPPRAVEYAGVPAAEQVRAGEDRFPYRADGQFGFIDGRGDVAIVAAFDEVGPFSEGLARVRREGFWGYIAPDGTMVIPRRFLDASDFSAGRARVVVPEARVDLGSRQGRVEDRRFSTYIDTAGNLITDPDLAEARDFTLVGDRALATASRTLERKMIPLGMSFLSFLGPTLQRRDGWVILSDYGREVADVRGAQRVLAFSEGLAAFERSSGLFGSQPRWGFVDTSGAVVISPAYLGASSFSEGLAAIATQEGYGYINAAGNVVVEPRFDGAGPFRSGLARVQERGLWGFIRPDGSFVIAPRFERASDFSDGLAAVQVDGRFGYVDRNGTMMLQPQFTLARPFRNGLAYVSDGQREGYIDQSGDFVWYRSAP